MNKELQLDSDSQITSNRMNYNVILNSNLSNQKFDKKLFNEALQLRDKLAIQYSQFFLESYDISYAKKEISNSLLKQLLNREPFTNCLQKLSFSQYLTDIAVNHILSSDKPLLNKVGLVGYVTEIGGREFIDPNFPQRKEKNLASSKKHGYFFTPVSLANEMSHLLINSKDNLKVILDPACGTGTLLAITLINYPQVKKVIGVEIDAFTSKIAKKLLEHVSLKLGVKTETEILNMDFLDIVSTNISHSLLSLKIDGIIMNPPYGRIRFTSSNLSNRETKVGLVGNDVTNLAKGLKKEHVENAEGYRKKFENVGLGKATPEFSTLFIAGSTKLLKKYGSLVAITPTSWLSDKNGAGLRKYLLSNHGLSEIWNFKETAGMFPGVNQATSVILLQAENQLGKIKIKADIESIQDLNCDSHELDLEKIYKFSPNLLRIPKYGNSRSELLEKIHNHKTLGMHKDILNLRGEFDLTFNKDLISKNKSETRLIRGDHIRKCLLTDPENSEKDGYVNLEKFYQRMGNSSKKQHISSWRIALPQCSYMQKKKRIEACIIPPKSVVANSCNYIVIKDARDQDFDTLLLYCAFLNSLVVEWRFRLFSSNNHIANYEIDELPVVEVLALSDKLKNNIILNMKSYLKTKDTQYLLQTDILVTKSYGLSTEEFTTVLRDLDSDQYDQMIKNYEKISL